MNTKARIGTTGLLSVALCMSLYCTSAEARIKLTTLPERESPAALGTEPGSLASGCCCWCVDGL